MPTTLKQEIDARTAGRQEDERESPGRFWGRNGVTLSRAEAEVFAIDYADFPRMQSVWDAWFDFLSLTRDGPIFYSREAIERERAMRPELTAGNELNLFEIFAEEVGGLTRRQAEAMYWKDWFWTVREGHVTYADEGKDAGANRSARH